MWSLQIGFRDARAAAVCGEASVAHSNRSSGPDGPTAMKTLWLLTTKRLKGQLYNHISGQDSDGLLGITHPVNSNKKQNKYLINTLTNDQIFDTLITLQSPLASRKNCEQRPCWAYQYGINHSSISSCAASIFNSPPNKGFMFGKLIFRVFTLPSDDNNWIQSISKA